MFGKISEEWKYAWKCALFLIAVGLLIGGIAFCSNRSVSVVDNAFINYEAFHDLYNSIKAIDQKICNHIKIPADDKAYKDLSKAAQITGLRNLMEQRISDYNSKSHQWNRSMWKSSELPYQLEASGFHCYPQEIK